MKILKRTVDALRVDPERDYFAWDEELHGFGVRVRPSGRKIYLVQYRSPTRRTRRYKLGVHGEVTAEQARKGAIVVLAAVARGGDPAGERQAARTGASVAELATAYLKKHLLPKRKASTAREFQRLLNVSILPKLGPRRVADVERVDVEVLHRSLASTPTTANRVLSLLSTLFNFAEREGMRPNGSNPTRHVSRYPERKRDRFLSAAELGRLGEALAAEEKGGAHPSAILAIRLLLLTGARRSEILNLRWREVDLERGQLRLQESKTGQKSIPVAAPALQLLANALRVEGNPFVCFGEGEGAAFVGIDKVGWRARRRAGLEDVRLHDLRHSFASVGAAAGLGLYVVGKVLGHRHAATTQRYAHLADDPLRAAAERISSEIAAAVEAGIKEGRRDVG